MKLLLCDTINIIVVLTTGNSQIEEIDAAKSTDQESAQATDLGTYYVYSYKKFKLYNIATL